ncbi:MAG: ankyrin repeat domain-containing protein [Akkermansiaceae bacterium]|nr:ankyrin repeat domain-containing protein [Armatimonadota bacterium]
MKLIPAPLIAITSLMVLTALTSGAAGAEPPMADTPVPGAASAEVAAGPKPASAPPGDPLGPDLFAAVTMNDTAGIKSLLESGARIDQPNWLGVTPLMWAAYTGNEAACAELLKNKANFRVDTVFGGVLEAADMGGNPRIVKRLLESGATFSKERSDKTSIVITAAEAGHTAILKMLIERKAEVNTPDAMGMSALMHASRRGQTGTGSLLLGAEAKVNVADTYGRTALMYAALNGHIEMVKRLLDAGAQANVKDKKGDTALMLAARYCGDASIARLLKAADANTKMRDFRNRTAGEIAQSHGYAAFAGVIGSTRRIVAAKPADLPMRARQAVQRSLPLIEKTTANFTGTVGCNSCHHQGVGLITTGTAKIHGYLINKFGVAREQKAVLAETQSHIEGIRQVLPYPEKYKHLPAVDIEEFAPAIGVSFTGLAQHGVPPSEEIEAMTTVLARQQKEDGSWRSILERAPVQSSDFTTTAYAIRVLNAYLPPALATERAGRIAKATAWLVTTRARSSEDRAFRLLGLKWAAAPNSEIAKAVAEIQSAQRVDGGWAQFSGSESAAPGYSRSDAYATGQSLYALHVGGSVKPTAATYRRGVDYLLRTQDDDGSWFVNKRAIPVNNYLDTGFPHGVSQYISYTGTCWATMSLIFAAGPARHPATLASQ